MAGSWMVRSGARVRINRPGRADGVREGDGLQVEICSANPTSVQPTSQVFLVGLPVAPIRLCHGTCALGVLPILVTVPGNELALPVPCGATLVGAEIGVQNVLVGGVGGCQPPSTPVPLVTSPTLVVRVR